MSTAAAVHGLQEPRGSSPTQSESSVIREVLQLDRDVKIDRLHRRDREKPRVIIAKVHNDGDAVEILRRARDRAPLVYNGNQVAVFPDYTSSIAKARAARCYEDEKESATVYCTQPDFRFHTMKKRSFTIPAKPWSTSRRK
ncbi:hypothetical protein LDENG_00278330 [Lucifuga dentata]|nr:hypothetical protein LDENG_00278330 [Lucifuga dentata]